jgi:hypothetical protein
MAEEFHLGIGGPFFRLERVTHLSLGRLTLTAIAIAWAPLLLLSLGQWTIVGHGEPLLRDPSIHVRFLVAIPLLLLAERLLDRTCHNAVEQLFGGGFVREEHVGRVRAILRQVERWRDSPWPEAFIVVGALGIGVATWSGLLHPPGVVHFEARGVVGAWYALVSLPLLQFLLWRSLFRWGLWARVLGGLSRVPLRLLPAHADRRGGIAFLKRPSVAYCALLLLAVSSVLCSGWASEIVEHGAKLSMFTPMLLVFIFVTLLIAFGPLFAFVPLLFTAGLKGRREYEALVSDYTSQFDERWLSGAPRGKLLGSADIQSLADLGTTYRESVEKMQVLLFSPKDLVPLLVAWLVPVLALLLFELPAPELLLRLLQLLIGGRRG